MRRKSEPSLPPERAAQFRFIEAARTQLFAWSRAEHIRLEHIEYVVPFVETDFRLAAWIFYASNSDVDSYANDGTSARVTDHLKTVLGELGYPKDWLSGVECYFASKQEVNERYDGSYYNYVR